MKKGLSILLVAAALFGFYGSAVSLNDVLACKDYWEKAGEESTANMNKLEDGLNQLKENEQAYLDGIDQLADGEKALADGEAQYAKGLSDYEAAPAKLADGEKQLAEGKAKLADGYSQYNQGKKDLAAGKKAVAQGEKDLAAGRKALAAGQDQLDSLNTLIGGIKQVLDGYPAFKNGYKQLRDGRVGAIVKPSDTSELQAVLNAYYENAQDAAAVKALMSLEAAGKALAAQDKDSFTNAQYDGFKDYMNATVTALDDSNTFFDNTKNNLSAAATAFNNALENAKQAVVPYKTVATAGAAYQAAGKAYGDDPTPEKLEELQKAQAAFEAAVEKYGPLDDVRSNLNDALAACQQVATNEKIAGAVQLATSVFVVPKDAATGQQVLGALQGAQQGLHIAQNDNNAGQIETYLTYVGTIPVAVSSINSGITGIQETTLKGGKDLANQWLGGYAQITSADTQGKQKQLVGGVAQIIGGVLASKNDELINGMNAAAKQVGFTPTDFTPAQTSKLAKDMASGSKLEDFYNDMNKIEAGFSAVLPALEKKAKDGAAELKAGKQTLAAGEKDLAAGKAAVAAGEKKLASAEKQLAQGEKDLAAGKAELAQGYADYAAAPGKLADAEKQLADGRKALADGKAKLAEYEDGEQQVRDGLATLAGTEADLDLKSILDRLGGDNDFDNGDGHLELDEGLAAVEVGRGYQAEDGVLITEEIMARAVGTGALLGAGVLAVIAALLSFLKKNKGAGVFAILAAAAGAFGAFYGTNAGTYFSSIAGSTVGATGWIAAGILGAVALVHAIVHFTAPKNA